MIGRTRYGQATHHVSPLSYLFLKITTTRSEEGEGRGGGSEGEQGGQRGVDRNQSSTVLSFSSFMYESSCASAETWSLRIREMTAISLPFSLLNHS